MNQYDLMYLEFNQPNMSYEFFPSEAMEANKENPLEYFRAGFEWYGAEAGNFKVLGIFDRRRENQMSAFNGITLTIMIIVFLGIFSTVFSR